MWNIELQKIVGNLLDKLRKLYVNGTVIKKFLAFLKLIEKPGQFLLLRTEVLQKTVDFLKVVRLVFWSGVVGPGTNDELSLARATRSKARLVSKSKKTVVRCPCNKQFPLSRREAHIFSITLTRLNRDNGHFPVSRVWYSYISGDISPTLYCRQCPAHCL